MGEDTDAPSPLVEKVARAICNADPLAPHPDAPIQWGRKSCLAWQARIPMAEAAIEIFVEESLLSTILDKEPSQ